MRGNAALFGAVLMLALTGCATPYGSEGLTGGYSEKQLEPQIWRVRFGGNGFTTVESVQTFWLYRCAELTRQQGYDGFQIVSNVQLVSLHAPDDAAVIQVHGGGGGFVYVPMYGGQAAKPALEADIRLLKRPFAVAPPKTFDAVQLQTALEPL